ncbi:MAG: T9SS type A sorting domain-containing protein [Bacteroidetes bacterium]|nr:T9SS type A sorting domain-containing protein [Bacteroidota bacterium]
MKKIIFLTVSTLFVFAFNAHTQCIKDIQNLISQPEPCFFIGYVDFDNIECFDVFEGPNWKYTWKIRSASDGELIASYDGLAFQHSFKKFGGYQFCLEIDKDGDPSNGADIVNCVEYTTCEICSGDSIKMAYNSCPYGEGCEITLSTAILAQNDYGLEPVAKFIVTYLPTPQELLGGYESYDINFGEFPVEYNPFNDSILVSQNIKIPFQRGCFKPRLVFKMKDGYGAHGMDATACTEIELRSEEKFRCIACANEDGECIASEAATKISNEEDSCDPFFFCNQLRETKSTDTSSRSFTEMLVSPNPAFDRLHLELPSALGNGARTILIYNQIGQPVIRHTVPNGEKTSIDLSLDNLLPGLYFVNLMENGKLLSSKQIFVQR